MYIVISSHIFTTTESTWFQLLDWRVWSNCPILLDCAGHLNTYFRLNLSWKSAESITYHHVPINTPGLYAGWTGMSLASFESKWHVFPNVAISAYPLICWENPSNLIPYLYFLGGLWNWRAISSISGHLYNTSGLDRPCRCCEDFKP